MQEALLAAALQWPSRGLPDNPKGWLVTVATRRWIEVWRNATARQRREQAATALAPDPDPAPAADDTLTLLFLCCHPALTPASQVALTLRAVGGLTTAGNTNAPSLFGPTSSAAFSAPTLTVPAGGQASLGVTIGAIQDPA